MKESQPPNMDDPSPLSQTRVSSSKSYFAHYFGIYGGRYVPELLIPALDQLEEIYLSCQKDDHFQKRLARYLRDAGRPTPLFWAANLSEKLGIQVYIKNEGQLHTGAHKLNNALGQALLAVWLKKKILIAETGAGQHGLATATAAAKLRLGCRIFMGEVDMERQYPNVYAMKMLGAEVIPVREGTRTLKDAVNTALKDWIENLDTCHYVIGSALGPHPYPRIVRDFQSIIGKESKEQFLSLTGRLPDRVIAGVGGGSNSLGMFHSFLEDSVTLVAVEAGGRGQHSGDHASRFFDPQIGVAQGYKSYFIQDKDGQLASTHSISAGLDYGGIGPELAYLHDCKRVIFTSAEDEEVMEAFRLLVTTEGIFPALESSHALAEAIRWAQTKPGKNVSVLINISGRGDKDIFITAKHLDRQAWKDFLSKELKNLEN